MFLWWSAPLLLLQLSLTLSTTVTLYQVTSSTVTVHITTDNNTLPTLLPLDLTLVFSPSLTLSDYDVFIPAKHNSSLTPPGTLELSLPRNLDLSKGVFYLFDRVIPHKLDHTIIELAVDSFFFSTSPVSETYQQQITMLNYPIDEVMVLRRCPPLAAFAPFHQELKDRVCEVNVVINEVSFSGKECETNNFITLYDGGVGQTNLTGFSLLIYEGQLLVQTVSLPTVTGDQGMVRTAFGPATGGAVLHHNTSKIVLQDSEAQVLDVFLVGVNNTQYNMTGVAPLLLSSRSYARCLCSTALSMPCFTQATPGMLHHTCQPRVLLITEVYFDSEAGFIELFDGGAGRTLLSGYEVVIFDDQSSRSLASFSLADYTTSASGFFVISSADNADMVIAQSQFRPHTVAVALYLTNTRLPVFSSTGQEATTEGLVDAVVFEGLVGVSKVAKVLTPAHNTLLYQVGSESYSRCDSLTPYDTEAYILSTPSPGASNDCILKERHWGAPTVFINEVFGAETCQRNHYIELASHQPNLSLANMSLVLYQASTGLRYFSVDLGDFTTTSQGLLILSREVISDGLLPTHGAYVISLYKGTKDTALPTTRGLVDSILYHFSPLTLSTLDYKFPRSHIVTGHGQSDGHPPVSNNYCPNCGAGQPCFQTASKTPNKLNLCKDDDNEVLYNKPYRVIVGVRPKMRFYTLSMRVMLSNATCSWWKGLMGSELSQELTERLRLSIRGHCSMFSIKSVTVVNQACPKGNYGVTTEYNVTIATIYAAGDLKRDEACLRTWSNTLSVLAVDGVLFTAHVVCMNNCKMGLESDTHTSVQIISVTVVLSLLLLAVVIVLVVKWNSISKYVQNRHVPDDMIELHNPSLCEDYELENDDLDYHSPEDGFI